MALNNKKQGEIVREKVLNAVIAYFQEHGYAPSYRELGEMVGLKSKQSVYNHVQRLIREGKLETDAEYVPRAIRVSGYKFVKESEAERLTPKEVTPYASSCDPSDMDIIDCPICGKTYWAEDWGTINYCPNCGQAIKVREG